MSTQSSGKADETVIDSPGRIVWLRRPGSGTLLGVRDLVSPFFKGPRPITPRLKKSLPDVKSRESDA